MRRAALLIVFALCMLSLPVGAKRLTQGFRLAKTKLEWESRSEWKAEGDMLAAREILDQPFFYLDKGAQCYVFESQDRRHVLKLFRFDQPQNPIRSFFQSKFKMRKKRTGFDQKVSDLFNACKMAYDLAKEETGLVYIHLNLTENELPVAHLKDPLGRNLDLKLDQCRFAIQRKAEPFRESLLAAIKRGDEREVKGRIEALLFLLKQRTSKGIGNRDPNLSRNFGFFEGKAIEIDFGNYALNPHLRRPLDQMGEMERYAGRLSRWLRKEAPEWAEYVDARMKAMKSEAL